MKIKMQIRTKYSLPRPAVIGVSIKPGQMALTVIPRDANSFALLLVNPITPALATVITGYVNIETTTVRMYSNQHETRFDNSQKSHLPAP